MMIQLMALEDLCTEVVCFYIGVFNVMNMVMLDYSGLVACTWIVIRLIMESILMLHHFFPSHLLIIHATIASCLNGDQVMTSGIEFATRIGSLLLHSSGSISDSTVIKYFLFHVSIMRFNVY
jgi:hypothetical protein